jgi:hypothetical protein
VTFVHTRPNPLVIDIGNILIEGILSELPLRPEDGVDDPLSELPLRPEDGVDDPLLIFSTGDLAWQLGLIKSPKSLHQFQYGYTKNRLMQKMDENHIEFIRDEARHCILNRRFPRRMTRREFAYRVNLLAFHHVLCSGFHPLFLKNINMRRLEGWLLKSAETLTLVIAKVGHRLRFLHPAWSIQLEAAVQ